MNPRRALAAFALLLAALLVLGSSGCGAQVSGESPAAARTEAELDTAIARSSLPGAGVVDRALRESGRQGGRAAALDSLQ